MSIAIKIVDGETKTHVATLQVNDESEARMRAEARRRGVDEDAFLQDACAKLAQQAGPQVLAMARAAAEQEGSAKKTDETEPPDSQIATTTIEF